FVDSLRLRVLLVQADAQQTQSRVQGVELRRRRRCEHRSVHDSQCGVDERGTGPPASAETATGVEQIENIDGGRDLVRVRLSDLVCQPVEGRSEEHTSELQSRLDLVCRLLLE